VADAVETAVKMTGAVRGLSIVDVRKAPACPDQRFQTTTRQPVGNGLSHPFGLNGMVERIEYSWCPLL